MYKDNLHELIDRYEMSIDSLYESEHDELFKWRATRTWRNEWFKPNDAFSTFIDRYNAARRDFSLFIDNSRMHPATGVTKMWEQNPTEVERLFNSVLFADTNRDISAVQKCMDDFLYGYEELRQLHFPRNWSYKMDRHAVSVFLSMMDPEFNYAYKASEANAMAKYTDFELGIGVGQDFSLKNYYSLCDEVVSALKEHDRLLQKHFEKLTDEFYHDESLHLLAFDLMYCSLHYNFYDGLIAPSTRKKAQQKEKTNDLSPEKAAEIEEARLASIQELEREIEEIELSCVEYTEISLIGVEVTSNKYGVGTVLSQEINKVTVQFENDVKTFILDKKYVARPRFEDDDVIVDAFTEYGKKQEIIKDLKNKLYMLQAQVSTN